MMQDGMNFVNWLRARDFNGEKYSASENFQNSDWDGFSNVASGGTRYWAVGVLWFVPTFSVPKRSTMSSVLSVELRQPQDEEGDSPVVDYRCWGSSAFDW